MNEIVRIDNLLKLLRRGQFTLSGEETLAFAQSYQYLIEKKTELSSAKPLPVIEVPSETPKTKKNKT